MTEFDDLGTGHQAGSQPFRSGAAGPSNTMDKVLGHLGQVVVDHVRDVVDVQATGGHVSCDQHLIASLLKSAERSVTLGLRTVAVNHRRGKTFAYQFLSQPFCASFGASED